MGNTIEKLERDGKVAVLYSRGQDGWSTWNGEAQALIFDRKLAEMVELVPHGLPVSEIQERASQLCPGGYFGGAGSLAIAWVPKGEAFQVEKHVDTEYVRILGPTNALIA